MTGRHLNTQILAGSLAAAMAFAITSGRARADVRVERYELTLAPDAAAARFVGAERIELALDHPTAAVTLDAESLVITRVEAYFARQRLQATLDQAPGKITIRFARVLPVGRVSLDLGWTGALSTDLRGIYATEAKGRSYVFTQLEPRAARRVFPCLDAPEQRARFVIHAVVQPDEQAVSNSAVSAEQVDAASKIKTITFAETPPIPAYLVSLAVGRFDIIEDRAGRTPIRVATVEGDGARAVTALATTRALIPLFERFLGVPFPFDKLDVVAVPVLAPHAMENAGAIFVRADELLLEGAGALPGARIQLTRRIAHELAHHWFGNLVTMATWGDLWLSEALARWAEFEMIDQLQPELQVWDQFHALRDSALTLDLRPDTHAVRTASTRVLPAFDAITYDKGAATLRMIQRWVGDEAFRGALHDYLTAHAFGAASGEDFWRALAVHSNGETELLAKEWFESPGHPTLEIDAECHGGVLDVHILQGSPHGNEHPRNGKPWHIPLVLHTATTTLRLIVRHARVALRLREPGGCPTWVRPDSPGESPFGLRYARTLVTGASEEPPPKTALVHRAHPQAQRPHLTTN